jgi:hypothetical protein
LYKLLVLFLPLRCSTSTTRAHLPRTHHFVMTNLVCNGMASVNSWESGGWSTGITWCQLACRLSHVAYFQRLTSEGDSPVCWLLMPICQLWAVTLGTWNGMAEGLPSHPCPQQAIERRVHDGAASIESVFDGRHARCPLQCAVQKDGRASHVVPVPGQGSLLARSFTKSPSLRAILYLSWTQ